MKFAEARSSKLAEIGVGDQVRARGVKSEDGLKVTAEDVVFGTFVTKAGTITAVNAETSEITVKDLANNKPLIDPHHGGFADQEDARHGRHDGRRWGMAVGGGLRQADARRLGAPRGGMPGMGGAAVWISTRCWNACPCRNWKI